MQQSSEVKDALSGKNYLEKTALAISGKPYATNAISEILFHITQIKNVPLTVQTAIRAVAFILEEQTELKIAESVARHTITVLAPHVAKIQEEASKLEKLSQDLNGPHNIGNQLENIQKAVDQVTNHVKDVSPPSSYKMALMAGIGPADQSKHIDLAARNAIKQKQVLISISADSPLAPGKATHAQLVEKINAALDTIKKEGSPETVIKAVNQFRNGNTVLELTSEAAAAFLREPDTKRAFIEALDPEATIKDRAYTVIFQFVPLTFDPDRKSNIDNLEKENGWDEGTVLAAKWVKPPGRRTNTQQVAHLMVSVKDPQSANNIIREGFTINQLKLQAKKNKREPIRCAKCQHYGHIARDCINRSDTCANCAEAHRTAECQDKKKKHCVSCNSSAHASWDRNCPEFKSRCIKLDERYVENTMPYFPTDEPWTHVLTPSKPEQQTNHSQANQTPSQQELPGTAPQHHQSTLERHMRGGYRGRGRGSGPGGNRFSPGPSNSQQWDYNYNDSDQPPFFS